MASLDWARFTIVTSEQDEVDIDLAETLEDGNSESLGAVVEVLTSEKAKEAIDTAEQGLKLLPPDESIPLSCQLVTFNLALARTAPKIAMSTSSVTKDEYFERAKGHLRTAEAVDPKHRLVQEAGLAFAIATAKIDDIAKKEAEISSQNESSINLVALFAKARVQMAKRQYRAALTTYQTILQNAPDFLPDPRTAIGLCFWFLGDRTRAKKAWNKSIKKYPGIESNSSALYLAIATRNEAREALRRNDEDANVRGEIEATTLCQRVFKLDKSCAVAASMLASHFIVNKDFATATKLADRVIHYSDLKAVSAEGHYVTARCLHAQGNKGSALVAYAKAVQERQDFMAARLASAHLLMQSDMPHAADTFQKALDRQPNCIEAQAGLAAIHAQSALTSTHASEAVENRKKALDAYETVLRTLTLPVTTPGLGQTIDTSMFRRIDVASRDPDLYVEIARLCTAEDPSKALKMYLQSLAVREANGESHLIPAQLYNNIGCLEYLRRDYAQAKDHFQQALQQAAVSGNAGTGIQATSSKASDAQFLTATYNLAIVLEALEEKEAAIALYKDKILEAHPEFIEAKARLALMHMANKEYDAANDLLKEALTAFPKSAELRALYTYYLIDTKQEKQARDFTQVTLQQLHHYDVYAHCAVGLLLFGQAREIRPTNAAQAKDKTSKSLRSAEFYEKAIRLDPHCAFAAMGLAIALAEGTLIPTASSTLTPQDVHLIRQKGFRDALSILTKVRDTLITSITDPTAGAGVYVNLGHVYSCRDEWDRAIENYSTALKRYYKGEHVPCFLYLSRAWFQKACKAQDFMSVKQALEYSQRALEKLPGDDSIKFNLAIIQHKGLEILSELPPSARTSEQIREAIAMATQAQALFQTLSEGKGQVPYPLDIAQQRTRYGNNLINRANTEMMAAQESYESSEQARVEKARREREEEKRRQLEAAKARQEEIDRRNKELQAERQKMHEAAMAMYEKYKADAAAMDIDEDGQTGRGSKKASRRKKEDNSGFVIDDGEVAPQPKRAPKRKATLARQKADAMASSEGEDDTPAADTAEQQQQELEDAETEEEEGPVAKKPRKVYKSTEFVQDSDEE